jgi:large subunit ribosomal protein L5
MNKMEKNKMKHIETEKMVLNCGGLAEKLEKSVKLLEMVTNRKIIITKSTKRIPDFGISPGKESGCKVTIRDKKDIDTLLKRFFSAISNKISNKKITENQFSFGIEEYIEIPGLEYKREIGMLGFDITVVFKRKGKRVILRKIKRGKYPKRQAVTKQEIIEYLTKHYGVEIEQNDSK